MKKIGILLILIILTSIDQFALPRFVLKNGGQCIDCHVNPTGGNIRNEGGWGFGKNSLSMFSTSKNDEDKMTLLSPMIGQNISFGLDMRTQYLVKMDSVSSKSDFQKMTGAAYFNVIASDKLNLFVRYDFLQAIYEAYGVLHILPNNGYIKVGTYSPNFGIRIDDHTAYTRGGDFGLISTTAAGLIYNPSYNETGIEVGTYFSDVAFFTASVGTPNGPLFKKDPTYTARLELMPNVSDNFNFMFGGSYANYKSGFVPNINNINIIGGFLGIGVENFTLLGEYDFAKNLVVKDKTSSALLAEISYKISKGLEAVIRYDRFDPNADVKKDEIAHLIIGAEFFPYSFIELRPQFRINTEEPSVKNNAFVMQFHIWY
jgi:hypothetical protein